MASFPEKVRAYAADVADAQPEQPTLVSLRNHSASHIDRLRQIRARIINIDDGIHSAISGPRPASPTAGEKEQQSDEMPLRAQAEVLDRLIDDIEKRVVAMQRFTGG